MSRAARRAPHVLIASHYYPPHVGGLEAVAREVAEGLHRAGHRVSVLTSSCGATTGLSHEDGVRVRRVNAWNGFERSIGVPFPIFSPMLLWHAFSMVRRADVVQIHDMLYLTSWVTALFARLSGTPYVVTQHVGLVAHSIAAIRWIQILVHRTLGGLVLRGAQQIIPINTFIEASTRKLLPHAPTTVLRNGVNTDRYRPATDREYVALRAKYGLPPVGLLFFYVGRFVPKKGFDLVASCVDDAYTLVFVGSDRPDEMPEDSRRIFLGSRSADEVAELYRTADLFICASVGESPLTVLEAMNSGVGVLLNDDPGLHALGVGGDGVRWLAMDQPRLHRELKVLADQPSVLTDMGEAAASTAADSFSWDHHVEELQRLMARSCGLATRQVTKVAVVTPYYLPRIGGVEHYAHRQVLALRNDPDFEPLVITTGTTQRTSTSMEDGVVVVRLGRGVTVSNTPINPRWVWQLPRLLDRHDVDIVSAHAPVPGLPDLAVRLAGDRPVVLTYHSGSLVKGAAHHGVSRGIDALLRCYERWGLSATLRRADRLVAVSPTSLANRRGATMITPGVDTQLFHPAPVPSGHPRLLYVGRLERSSAWKGVDVLIRALARVRESIPDVALEMVGDGDAVPDLRALASELGVASAIEWSGALTHRDLVAHYQRAHAIVLPSLTESESFGMSLIEAMACARPVIASRVGGVPFVVRPGVDGVLVAPGDDVELAAACVRVLRDPERANAMGAEGRRAVEDRFAWSQITRQMLAVFRELKVPAVSSQERRR